MKATVYFDILASHTEQKKEEAEKIIKSTFENLRDQLKKNEKIKIINTEEAEIVERELDINGRKMKAWSSFLKAEIEYNEIEDLMDFILWYSPSRIELDGIREVRIITNEKEIKIPSVKFNEMLNTITARIIDLSRVIFDLNIRYIALQKLLEKYQKEQDKNKNQPK